MLLTKIKIATGAVLITAALVGAAGLIYQASAVVEPMAKDRQPSANKDQTKDKDKQVKGRNEKLRVLIDKVLAAHGGEEKLSKLKFIEEVENPNLPDPTDVKYFVQPPDGFREELRHNLELTSSIRVHILQKDGMKRWTTYPKGWRTRPKPEKEQWYEWYGPEPMTEYYVDYAKFFGPRRVLRLKDPDHRVGLLDEVKIDGRPAVGVELTKAGPKFKLSLKMFFDKETSLLVKEENDLSYSAIRYHTLGYTNQRAPGEENVHSSSAIFYTDYKKFDGIPIAQKEIYAANGKYASETKVTSLQAVEKLDAKLFEEP